MPIIQTENLTKHFDGVKAVDGLSVEIERGKITGIIGPNGSGKTTLVNLLSGMVGIDGGTAIVNDALKLSKIKPYDIYDYGITRTFQEVRLFNQMTVLDNMLAVLTERNVLARFFERHNDYHLGKARDALEKVNLWEKEMSWRSIFLTARENCWKSPAPFPPKRKCISWTNRLLDCFQKS